MKLPWVAPLKGDTSKAYCTICKKAFRIDGSVKSQVSSHHKSHSIKDGGQNTKKKPAIDSSQWVFQPTLDGKISMSEKTSLPLNHSEQFFRTEIYEALHVVVDNEFDTNSLLHLSMDGPNVNLAFQEKLSKHLRDNLNKSFVNLGTCSLHSVHPAFHRGITSVSFNLDQVFMDSHFFFKLSNAWREDYQGLRSLTDTLDKFVIKHVETRWLSMKQVAVRIVEQWDNLTEYFLKFLPKQKDTFRKIKKTARYQRIAVVLEDSITLVYVSFCAFIAQDFEMLLLPFQSDRSMIHLLYPEMQSFLQNLMMKFNRPRYLTEESTARGLHIVQVYNKKRHKVLNKIYDGTKVKCLFAEPDLLPSEKQKTFQEDYLKFYESSVSYLQSQLPFGNSFSWREEKRLDPGGTSDISNIALNTVYSHEKLFTVCFWCIPFRNCWRFMWFNTYSVARLPNWIDSRRLKQKSLRRECTIIFANTTFILGICTQRLHDGTSFNYIWNYCGMDEFLQKVGTMSDSDGSLKCPWLFALMKCVLSLSHSNSVSGRRFSVNKIMLKSHGYSIDNDTIAALRLVKDFIRKEGVDKFLITRKLLNYAFKSYAKYREYLASKRREDERERKQSLKQFEMELKSVSCKWKLQMKSLLIATEILVWY